jgi:hypothetical protein
MVASRPRKVTISNNRMSHGWWRGPELLWAQAVAQQILGRESFRWAHTLGVVRLVKESLAMVPREERSVVLAAAYVHDLGHVRRLKVTRCHALDGAMYVWGAGHQQLAAMVAQHSGARYEARLRGLGREMTAFPLADSSALDLLTYSDLKMDHYGRRCSVDERLEGIAIRYGKDHIVTRALQLAESELRQSVFRVESWLRAEANRSWASPESDSHRSVA